MSDDPTTENTGPGETARPDERVRPGPEGRRSEDARRTGTRSGPGENTDPTLLEALPGLARIGARAGFRTLAWMANETLTTGEEIVSAVAEGESPVPVVREATREAWGAVARSLGTDDPAGGSRPGSPRADRTGGPRTRPGSGPVSDEELRRRGARLLAQSADVRFDEDGHPAFTHILDELTPDEARILRFLATDGPQPAVDVRTHRPFGVGSELVAAGLSMVGLQAGVRHLDRTRSYLDNLHRLGLVWFSREPVAPGRYQVVEVQPEVAAALERAGRASRTIRRSIHLTPFGEDFCRTCLPVDPPGHAS